LLYADSVEVFFLIRSGGDRLMKERSYLENGNRKFKIEDEVIALVEEFSKDIFKDNINPLKHKFSMIPHNSEFLL
jgi:hypothetical protein